MRWRALGERQQGRAKSIVVVRVAVIVARIEHPGVTTVVVVPASIWPTVVSLREVAVIVAPGLVVRGNRRW